MLGRPLVTELFRHYPQAMQSHAGIGHKWRRFNRKYGMTIFLICVVTAVIIMVGLLMWLLTDPGYRERW